MLTCDRQHVRIKSFCFKKVYSLQKKKDVFSSPKVFVFGAFFFFFSFKQKNYTIYCQKRKQKQTLKT